MELVIAGLTLATLAALLVWRAASRWWHRLVIIVIGVVLFPPVARWLTGDVSAYLPERTFSDGADGKDQIVIASAIATILVAIILAACLWAAGTVIWRNLRRK
jgi:hypothetical protein